MRILVLTGLYPPYGIGGHEIHCREICGKLRERGLDLRILTSHYGVPRPCREDGVDRLLNAYGFEGTPDWQAPLLERALHDWKDCRILRLAIERFRPHVVFLWVSHCLTRALFSVLAETRVPVVWQDGGDCVLKAPRRRGRWLRFCEEQPAGTVKRTVHRSVKAITRVVTGGVLPQRLVFPSDLTVYQCSRYCFEATETSREIPLKEHLFIHPGVDLSLFKPAQRRPQFPAEIRLLCPGRIHECKGQLDAVKALARIRNVKPDWKVELWFTGGVQDQAYGRRLDSEIGSLNLRSLVKFLGVVPREELYSRFRSCDLVLFTSNYPEPFGTVIAEAKACGRPVVGSAVGGAIEQMEHGKTAMVYCAGDVEGLADHAIELCENLSLYDRIAAQGRKDVEQNFSMDSVADRVAALLRVAGGRESPVKQSACGEPTAAPV